jgi:hypothetical protein
MVATGAGVGYGASGVGAAVVLAVFFGLGTGGALIVVYFVGRSRWRSRSYPR